MASGSPAPNAQPTGEHELQELGDTKSNVPLEEDIMQLARLGEIAAIQKLFDSGKYDATYKDEQGITPLHVRISLVMRTAWTDTSSGPQLIITMPYAIS